MQYFLFSLFQQLHQAGVFAQQLFDFDVVVRPHPSKAFALNLGALG